MTCRNPRSDASVTRDHWIPDGSEVGDGVAENCVVHQRGQQIVGRGDRVGVAGEVDVDFVLRDYPGVPSAGAAALDAEDRPQRRLPQVDRNLVAQPSHALRQPDGRGGLPLARRRRRDARDDDRLAPAGAILEGVQRNLRLVVAVGQHVFGLEAEGVGNLADGLHCASGWRFVNF